jgi:hypothetical protein
MSLAGFDIVIEIARTALLDVLKSNLEIDGQPANPPFELTVPLPGDLDDGMVHVIVDDLLFELNGDDTATLTFPFSNSSVLIPAPGPTITDLRGQFSVTAPLLLEVSSQSNLSFPTVNLAAASVTVDFSNVSKDKLTEGLGGTGVSVAQFTAFATSAVQTFLQQVGPQPLGNGYSVVSGSNGGLAPLRFERLELHTIVADSSHQALGLFGILFAANTANGDATLKTAPAIASGHDTCVTISSQVFHTLIFCPAIAQTLAVPVELLPESCGSFPFGVPIGDEALTKLTDTFVSGKILLNGSAHKSGVCYEADATFHGELTITASGTTLTPNVQFDEPDVDVSIDGYCGPAGGVAIGLTALINVAITNAIAEAVAQDLADGALDSVLGNALPSENLGINGVDFDLVTIASDRLAIHGNTIVQVPPPRSPGLILAGSVTTSDTTVIGTGTYTATAPLCRPEDFPYTEYAQEQVASYQAIPTLLGLPLTLEWWILAGDGVTKVGIPKKGGEIAFATQTFYTMPLPAGTYVDQIVHVHCTPSGDVMQMTNIPAEGNYRFALYAKATDPVGNVVQILTPGFSVIFEGSAVFIGGGYQEYVAACMARLGKLLKKFSKHVDVELTPWVPVNYPEPKQLLDHFITLATSNHPNATDALLESFLAHGSSTQRALFSGAAKQIGKVKSAK